MNELMKTGTTGLIGIDPKAAIVLKSLDKVDGIVNAYKEYKIAQGIEETRRTALREQTKVSVKNWKRIRKDTFMIQIIRQRRL